MCARTREEKKRARERTIIIVFVMPVHRPVRPIASTSNSRKSMGFSINDIIKNDDSTKTSTHSNPPLLPSYPPPTSWLPPPASIDPIVQYQLQYLRHSGRLFDGRFASKFCSCFFLLLSIMISFAI